jgi:hypothetical protein
MMVELVGQKHIMFTASLRDFIEKIRRGLDL